MASHFNGPAQRRYKAAKSAQSLMADIVPSTMTQNVGFLILVETSKMVNFYFHVINKTNNDD